ncbi:hypothetical protein SAMN05421837_105434 [Amycolatopsis pretoriensis]|uniref:Uncharacterized protein n=1 Tax=Amycolatopsis pretoriensis TaxID=218821 RepID=A0A1H5QZX4_9PSEU|nr:hypothetical protein SAMN05421837_105434 [Amycolatopsis pretoriensis]
MPRRPVQGRGEGCRAHRGATAGPVGARQGQGCLGAPRGRVLGRPVQGRGPRAAGALMGGCRTGRCKAGGEGCRGNEGRVPCQPVQGSGTTAAGALRRWVPGWARRHRGVWREAAGLEREVSANTGLSASSAGRPSGARPAWAVRETAGDERWEARAVEAHQGEAHQGEAHQGEAGKLGAGERAAKPGWGEHRGWVGRGVPGHERGRRRAGSEGPQGGGCKKSRGQEGSSQGRAAPEAGPPRKATSEAPWGVRGARPPGSARRNESGEAKGEARAAREMEDPRARGRNAGVGGDLHRR